MDNTMIEARLKAIEEGLNLNKKVFNTTDLHRYTKLSKSTIYKLTSRGKIPHYCPTGKIIFFDKDEVDSWLLSNKNESEVADAKAWANRNF
jgi:excisionase family DNA binding protein